MLLAVLSFASFAGDLNPPGGHDLPGREQQAGAEVQVPLHL